MKMETLITNGVIDAVKQLYDVEITAEQVSLNETLKDFAGDITVVVFPLTRVSKQNPVLTGETIGAYLKENIEIVDDFNVVKGFLNLEINNSYWLNFLSENFNNKDFGKGNTKKKTVIEYCGPNTNKPLHLGHIRNMLLGYSTANLLSFAGNEVHKVNIYNDRGIAICKSMLAWQKFGEGKTPESEGIKGDHFVGKYYVEFDKHYKVEVEKNKNKIKKGELNLNPNDSSEFYKLNSELNDIKKQLRNESKLNLASKAYFNDYLEYINEGLTLVQFEEKLSVPLVKEFDDKTFKMILSFEKKKNEIRDFIQEKAEKESVLLKEAQAMLVKWEAGDEEVLALWNKMNNWCYEGFEVTFKALGVDFEKHYKESDYYERGKELVEEGLAKDFFYKKEDNSVWVDLEDKGLDHKLLLRGDGTSVYITQDMGIAEARYQDYAFDESIYVVASEQDYHFKVLQLALEKMDKPYAEGIYHLSYGLVNLPNGRMKSREGTVVDADDLIEGMIATAEEHTKELGKVDDFTDAEAKELYYNLAMGALKYFILKVDPKKSVIFNPEESIDFQGNTGPFIQFNYVRIQSLLRKQDISDFNINEVVLTSEEKDLLKELHKFPAMIDFAAKNYDISQVTSFAFNLAKTYSKFYANTYILNDTSETEKNFRLQLSQWTGEVLKTCFAILGIAMPTRM